MTMRPLASATIYDQHDGADYRIHVITLRSNILSSTAVFDPREGADLRM